MAGDKIDTATRSATVRTTAADMNVVTVDEWITADGTENKDTVTVGTRWMKKTTWTPRRDAHSQNISTTAARIVGDRVSVDSALLTAHSSSCVNSSRAGLSQRP